MPVKSFSTRIDIKAPASRVWRVMSNVDEWPRWTASVAHVERLDPGPLRVGMRVRLTQPRLRAAIWTVTSVVDGWAFTWEMRESGVHAVGSHQIEPAAGGSRVTLTITFHGVVSSVVGWLLQRLNRRYLAMESEGLKRQVESLPFVRDATGADVDEIVRVTNLAYRVEDFFINGDRTTADDVRSRMAKSGARFLVVDAARPSMLASSIYMELRGDHGYFGLLAVDPAEQNKGLARLLIQAVEDRCREAGCAALHIDVVNLREELPAFYDKLGFKPFGTAEFPDQHKLTREVHLVLMKKPLTR